MDIISVSIIISIALRSAVSYRPSTQIPQTDRIQLIEIFSDQIIITTSKIGTGDKLRIKLDLIDFSDGSQIKVVDFNGAVHENSRGKYAISLLNSNNWYGILFRSENVVDGITHMNIEEKLVRTQDKSPNKFYLGVNVSVNRYGGNGYRLENALLNIQWTDEITRKQISDSLITASLKCNSTTDKRNIILDRSQRQRIEVFEIGVETSYNISDSLNEITATIVPKTCEGICWRIKLRANRPGHQFLFENDTVCAFFETLVTTEPIRQYQDYEVLNDELHIETSYEAKNGSDYEDGNVLISLFQLAPWPITNAIPYSVGNITASYSTINHSNVYTITQLEPDEWYGAELHYTKYSPFHYQEIYRFIVESPAVNSSDASYQPLKIRLPIEILDNKTGKIGTAYSAPLIVVKDKRFLEHKMRGSWYFQCENGDRGNYTEFWLNTGVTEFEFDDVNVEEILCSPKNFSEKYCQPGSIKKSNPSKCGSTICYRYQIQMESDFYDSDEKCVDLIEFYSDYLAANSSKSLFNVFSVFVFIFVTNSAYRLVQD